MGLLTGRHTQNTCEICFMYFCKEAGIKYTTNQSLSDNPGAWYLDYNATYGGYEINCWTAEKGEHRPFAQYGRMKRREFYLHIQQMRDFIRLMKEEGKFHVTKDQA